MSLCTSWKRTLLVCVCGWYKTGWQETEYWSDVESTQQRSWFGRTNIVPWPCIPGMYSKTMWNKQRYCWQLQNHVWIQNLCWSFWKLPSIGNLTWTFPHGPMTWKVMRRNVWKDIANWRTKQLNSISKSQHHELTTINFKEEEMGSVGELSRVCSQIVLRCLCLARIGGPDISLSVKKLARAVPKWTKACDKRLARWISHIHHTCEFKQYCHAGNTAEHCRLGSFQDSDFAGDLQFPKKTSGGILCILGSHTFVSISWMCKTQTSVSHSSTEAEITSLDAGLRMDEIPALDLWDLVIEVFHSSPNQVKKSKDRIHGNMLRNTPSKSTPRIKPKLQPRTTVLLCFTLTVCLRMQNFLSPMLRCMCLRTMRQ